MNRLKEILNSSTAIKTREAVSYSISDNAESLFKTSFSLVDKTVKEFEWLPEYDEVVKWLRDSDGKGLALFGSVGRGKSVIVNGVIPLIFHAVHNKVLRPIPARELHNHPVGWAACIDDVGQDGMVNDYGTKVFAVDSVISDCEDNMKLLILSSNLTKSQIVDKYGERVMDRINRLCKIVVFKGKSFRK